MLISLVSLLVDFVLWAVQGLPLADSGVVDSMHNTIKFMLNILLTADGYFTASYMATLFISALLIVGALFIWKGILRLIVIFHW